MKKFIIGALVLLIGIPVFSFTFFNLLNFLTGMVPVLMILGGAIAIYLGIEELKQADTKETEIEPPEAQPKAEIKENAEKSEAVLDRQDIKPVSEPVAKTEQTSTNTADEVPEPETPQNTECPSTLPGEPAESLAAEAEAPADQSVQFKGNIETLVFHNVACNFASGKNCSMDFTTKEEAESQGYKPCKICMVEA